MDFSLARARCLARHKAAFTGASPIFSKGRDVPGPLTDDNPGRICAPKLLILTPGRAAKIFDAIKERAGGGVRLGDDAIVSVGGREDSWAQGWTGSACARPHEVPSPRFLRALPGGRAPNKAMSSTTRTVFF